jgi:hypothetical protein
MSVRFLFGQNIDNDSWRNRSCKRKEVHTSMARRIQIKGVRRSEVDADLLAYVYFLEGKRLRRTRRECEVRAKAKRREHKTQDARRGQA